MGKYKVCVLQCDNRKELWRNDFMRLNREVNHHKSLRLGYKYRFINFKTLKGLSPPTCKVFIVDRFLRNNPTLDALILLDSQDAYIYDEHHTDQLVNALMENEEKHGCFSRDPVQSKDYPFINEYPTYINSGSFIIKNNKFIHNMYREVMKKIKSYPEFWNKWPYDQFFIASYIYTHREYFYIFQEEILNTPYGRILRHNWNKGQPLLDDLWIHRKNQHKVSSKPLDIPSILDSSPFDIVADHQQLIF